MIIRKNTLFKPNEIIKESYTELAKHIFDKEAVDAVVVDIDLNVSGPKIIRAQMYLTKNPESILIIGATDMLLPVRSGINIIGNNNKNLSNILKHLYIMICGI